MRWPVSSIWEHSAQIWRLLSISLHQDCLSSCSDVQTKQDLAVHVATHKQHLQNCEHQIRNSSSIRHLLTTPTPVYSLDLSWLDYCNSLLSGCLQRLLDRFQKVQNAAARRVYKAKKSNLFSKVCIVSQWNDSDRQTRDTKQIPESPTTTPLGIQINTRNINFTKGTSSKKDAPTGIYTLHFRHTRRHICIQAYDKTSCVCLMQQMKP